MMTRVARLPAIQLLLAVALLLSGHLYSTTVYSTQDGLWMDPDTWGGVLPDLTEDSMVVAHAIILAENITIEGSARLMILPSGRLEETGNRTLNIEAGTVMYNAGEIQVNKIKNDGTIFNTGLIDLEGDFINHEGTIYNDQMIYTKNLLTQGGMISGDGGQYMIWNNLNSTGETIATCTGERINICNPDGITDPCNGDGFFDPECVMICGQLLSLDLLSFEATFDRDRSTIEVTWMTSHEVGISYFVLERSSASTMRWLAISPTMQSVGNMEDGNYSYRFLDTHPLAGMNIYRLACYNLDGNVEYSQLASAMAKVVTDIGVVPNPFMSEVEMYGDVSGYDLLEIIDASGRLILVHQGDLNSPLQLGTLEHGWYLARLTGAENEIHFPILKF
jgi:hypothetical protein